jgi:ABC-type nitrate/sulfonate/bicarbonate transport system ATPase subunit
MLELKNITKSYKIGETKQKVLKGININFRRNEFTSILGFSGSGKNTLLNIIGGLDKYDEGDLIIEGLIAGCLGVGIASMSLKSSIFLILLSVILNVIAGMSPAGVAAKKDPVEALRTD